jgi:hypothetical protein
MNQISLIPSAMPQHIAQSRRDLAMNDAAMANWGARFATVSFKGKRWAIRYRGEEEALKASPGVDHQGRPLAPMPIAAFPVIVVGVAPHLSKNYYAKGYSDGDENAPDCFSVNSIRPDEASPHKQCETCAACDKNRFGSAITQNGSKAKACRDIRRVAVVPAGDVANEQYGGAMLLRLPPASIPHFQKYAADLKRVGVSISEVVTSMTFVEGPAHPEVEFAAVGFIESPDDYRLAGEHAASDEVQAMLFSETVEATPDNQPVPSVAPSVAALKDAPRPAHLSPAPAPAQAAAPTSAEAAIAAVQRRAEEMQAPKPAPVTVVQGAPPEMEQEIDDLLTSSV